MKGSNPMRLYILTGIGTKITTPYRRTALSAADAVRQKSTMLNGLCQEVVVEDGLGRPVDWPTLDVLSSREAESAHRWLTEATMHNRNSAAL
jgi:hypothetical protein